jgi:N6-L-threonylcarbamoyladenine synthase
MNYKTWRRTPRLVNNIAASFQVAAIEPLITKTQWALEQTGAKTLLLGGGVAANALLREQLRNMIGTLPGTQLYEPDMAMCMDNGVMIAAAGAIRATQKKFTPWQKLSADPGWELVDRAARSR